MNGKSYFRRFYGGFSKTLNLTEEHISKVELPVEETDEVCEKWRKMVIKWADTGNFWLARVFPSAEMPSPFLMMRECCVQNAEVRYISEKQKEEEVT